jgi:tetratricopeptide (TPR) repeat protein
MNLGAHYVLAREAEVGLSYLERAAEMDPEDGEVRFNLGATLGSMGRLDDAIRQFEVAEKMGIEIAREMIEKLERGRGEGKVDVPGKDKNKPE